MIRRDTSLRIAVFSPRNRYDQSNTELPKSARLTAEIGCSSGRKRRSAPLVNHFFYGLSAFFSTQSCSTASRACERAQV
jgi:hypothetical protein